MVAFCSRLIFDKENVEKLSMLIMKNTFSFFALSRILPQSPKFMYYWNKMPLSLSPTSSPGSPSFLNI